MVKSTKQMNVSNLRCIMDIKPNKQHKNWWKYNSKPSHTSIITISIHFQKYLDQLFFKIVQKYLHLPSGKFVNGDIFSLFLKLNCFITFGDINIIIILKCGHNRKNKIYLLKPTYHIFYKSFSLHKIEFELTYISNK